MGAQAGPRALRLAARIASAAGQHVVVVLVATAPGDVASLREQAAEALGSVEHEFLAPDRDDAEGMVEALCAAETGLILIDEQSPALDRAQFECLVLNARCPVLVLRRPQTP